VCLAILICANRDHIWGGGGQFRSTRYLNLLVIVVLERPGGGEILRKVGLGVAHPDDVNIAEQYVVARVGEQACQGHLLPAQLVRALLFCLEFTCQRE